MLAAQAGFARVRGVREYPAVAAHPHEVVPYAPGSMSDPEWQRGYALLEARGLSFDLRVPFWHLPEARALAERFPGIVIILDHTGSPSLRSPRGARRVAQVHAHPRRGAEHRGQDLRARGAAPPEVVRAYPP